MFHGESDNSKNTRRISSHDSSRGYPCAKIMKKAKRAISILMCAALLICLLPTVALAAVTGTVSFQVQNSNGASGTVSYRFGDTGEFYTVELDQKGTATVTNTNNEETITVKAIPTETINQSRSGVYINGSCTTSFDFTALTGGGFTYNLTDTSPQFRIEFDRSAGSEDNSSGGLGDYDIVARYDENGGSVFFSLGDTAPEEPQETYFSSESRESFNTAAENDTPVIGKVNLNVTPLSQDAPINILVRYAPTTEEGSDGLDSTVVRSGVLQEGLPENLFTWSDNVLSFTPLSRNGVEVEIWWTENSYQYGIFAIEGDKRIIVESESYGDGQVSWPDGIDQDDTRVDGSRTKARVNPSNFTSGLTFTWNENQNLNQIRVEGAGENGDWLEVTPEEGQTSYTLQLNQEDRDYYRVEFVFGGGGPSDPTNPDEGDDNPDEDNPGGENPTSPNYQALADALRNYVFAYYGADADAIKLAMANELSQRRIGGRDTIGIEECALGEVLGKNATQLISNSIITLNNLEAGNDDTSANLLDRSYYPYTIVVKPAEGENPAVTATGKVYVLNTARDIVVKSTENGAAAYSVITLSEKENATTSVYVDGKFDEVYGNGAWLNENSSEDTNIQVFHVTQEHAGGLNSFPIGSKLLVGTTSKAVSLSYDKDAAAWSFSNANAYSVGTEDAPTRASVFYGAGSITLGAVDFANRGNEPTITGIEVLNLPASAVSITGSTITFLTNYDYIKLKIKYSDSSIGYLDIARVGLTIDGHDVQNAPDGTTWGAGTKTFNVFHGTDQSVRYQADNGAEKVITASFYYNDSESAGTNDAVANKFNSLSRVSLCVTCTMKDRAISRTVLNASDAVTRSPGARPVNNGGFSLDEHNFLGYAGQGTCHFYDDFIVWSGRETEFHNIDSISVIAFVAGSDSSFGGVQVGSGAGVEWVKSEPNPER